VIHLISHTITELAHRSLDVANQIVQRSFASLSRAWNAHRTAMERSEAYRQAFYAGGTALLSAGTARHLWMAVVGMLLSLYVAIFRPIKTSWSARPLNSWDDDDPYERW